MRPTIQLASGRYFDYTKFRPEDINIGDIAHALSHLCRYTGHCRHFYSVAQHSVEVSLIVRPELALEGLLHDASEAYLGDVNRPLKLLLPDYKDLEHRVDVAIRTRFGLPAEESPEVKEADNILLVTEQRDLMPPATFEGHPDEWAWARDVPRLGRKIIPTLSRVAEDDFIKRFNDLIGERT